MYTSCEIISLESEVAHRDAWQGIEGVEGDILAEGDAIENRTKRCDPKLVGVNGPGKAGIMQEERGESGEPPRMKISVVVQQAFKLC